MWAEGGSFIQGAMLPFGFGCKIVGQFAYTFGRSPNRWKRFIFDKYRLIANVMRYTYSKTEKRLFRGFGIVKG